MELLNSLTQYGDIVLLLARVVLFAIFWHHGVAKIKFAKGFYFWLGAWETAWSLAVLLGFLTNLGGLALAIVMVGAIYMKSFKWKMPFVAQDKTGYELDLALLALGLLIFIFGAGVFSLDAFWWNAV